MVYTLGEWHVKEGSELAFVSAWRELGEWTEATIPGNTWAKLLQDRDDPRRFISFGPWVDDEAVSRWREHPGFGERVNKIQELLESFVPHRMDVAAQSGAATPDP
jgi:heme-degrading monooxygenase HmoA